MSHIDILIAALILDALIGDPDWLWRRLPHPAAVMGRAVSALDRHLNRAPFRRAKGVVALLVLGLGAALVGWLFAALPDHGLLETVVVAVLLAQNSLARHVGLVARALEKGLAEGRRAVAMIVGRDPAALDESGVARSAIESAAENFSDGVVAPAFWFLVGGLPGMLLYKAVNTADSMIGYRTPRHAEFGWASARFDDLLNLIPARLSGLLICAAHLSLRAARVMWRDAPLHRSPNAGWPEAAAAAVSGVAISGPRSYDGVRIDYPFVNAEGRRDLGPGDIDRAVRINWRSWALMLALLVFARLVWSLA
jgi:adenosylcobinamide-phosphate synthase